MKSQQPARQGQGNDTQRCNQENRRNPTMMKLGTVIPYLKKFQKLHESHDTPPWVLLTSAFFYRESANFAVSRNTDIDSISIHNF